MPKRSYDDFKDRLDKELEQRRNPPAQGGEGRPIIDKLLEIKAQKVGGNGRGTRKAANPLRQKG